MTGPTPSSTSERRTPEVQAYGLGAVLTSRAVLPGHPPRRTLPLHRDPDLRELGQNPRPRLRAVCPVTDKLAVATWGTVTFLAQLHAAACRRRWQHNRAAARIDRR